MPANNIYIINRSGECFSNRIEAGKLLAASVKSYVSDASVILGIPRGGIIIADAIAKELSAELDVMLVKKIGAPANPEFAIGAIGEEEAKFINQDVLKSMHISKEYVEQEKENKLKEIKLKAEFYRRIKQKVSLKNKTVIITDDGVATGATMQAAAWATRQENPKKIIIALPVGPEETLEQLSKEVDQIICLRVPEFFTAVGQFYIDFPQIEDSEVAKILKS